MAADARARYADAGELAADLRAFVTGQLVGAYRYGRVEQLRRFVRRHRAAVGVGAVALAAIAIIASLSIRRVLAERDDARAAREIAEHERRETSRKNDELLVQHATQLIPTEPARAIAVLRNLPPSSALWPRAAAVAQAAAANGIPFGFSLESAAAMVDASPDSRRIAIKPLHSDAVQVIDLHARTRVVLHSAASARSVRWIDERTLVVVSAERTQLIDLAGAPPVEIAGASGLVALERGAPGSVWALTHEGELHQLTTATRALGPEVARDLDIAQHIEAVACQKDHVTLREGHGRL